LRRPVFHAGAAWLVALGLMLCLLGPGTAGAEALKVTQPNQSMFPDPDFASPPIAAVPVGSEVNVLHQAGDWYKVESAGKEGWMHRQSFPTAQPGKFNLGSLLFGAPAKQAKSDEVALAGKGFNPEVESSYRQKHPEANFAKVDRVEGNRVEPARLQTFIQEGELKP
jgi:hypothetical protein